MAADSVLHEQHVVGFSPVGIGLAGIALAGFGGEPVGERLAHHVFFALHLDLLRGGSVAAH
ncbi:hypothetical protein [Streptomyces arenae]|uniref:hypothetical protein n=1 Tax=Streptomyces arenae TaxID=29301 RepID=UPI002657BBFD|nr:hypothetical protein [Streptomyces arenae]MCG7206609.1 hypothetical protein [Streptomyces arenae]